MQTYGQMTQDPTAPARDLVTYSGSVRIRDYDSGEAGRYRIPYRPYPCILETICCLPDYSDSNVPVRIKSHQAVSRQTAIWRPTPNTDAPRSWLSCPPPTCLAGERLLDQPTCPQGPRKRELCKPAGIRPPELRSKQGSRLSRLSVTVTPSHRHTATPPLLPSCRQNQNCCCSVPVRAFGRIASNVRRQKGPQGHHHVAA